jgi:uroporphyrinogen decarboxylase
MNSRQRILAAIDHQTPDGLPVDFGSTSVTGISATAYYRLSQTLGMKGSRTRVYDVVSQLALVEPEIIEKFHADAVDIARLFNQDDQAWKDFTLPSGIPVQIPTWFQPVQRPGGEAWDVFDADGDRIASMPLTATFFDQTYYPYLDGYPTDFRNLSQALSKVLWTKLVRSPWDHVDEPDFWNQLRLRAISFRQTSDRALVFTVGCSLFETGCFLRRMDNFLVDMLTSPAQVESLLDTLVERYLATLEKICLAVGDVVDVLRFGDDLGTDLGPIMSPKTYRSLFKPRQKILCDYIKKHSQMRILLHSDGSIYKLIPDLIEVGFDILNPIQMTAKDMQPERLKQDFGKDIAFWGGGCDTRYILNSGTPDEVKSHVRKNIEALAPGGGYVFATVHNTLSDVPPENVLAMFEAVDEYR